MAEAYEIGAAPREQIGKSSRKLAREGRVPAVLYGAGHSGEPLSLDGHEFGRLLAHGGVRSTVLHLKIAGKAKPVNAMVKALQVDPTKGTPIHVDLLAIKMDETVQTSVTLSFVGEAPGVKGGGVLNQNHTSVNVEALPGDLPEAIEVDISALDMGSTLTFADITAPAGVTILNDPEELVVSVTVPQKIEEEVTEAVEGEEGAEPEVIGETQTEEEGGE
jgi:large subunit ribosomal protein L25